jgi:hypothetical protein
MEQKSNAEKENSIANHNFFNNATKMTKDIIPPGRTEKKKERHMERIN